jgi:hypothetical protein
VNGNDWDTKKSDARVTILTRQVCHWYRRKVGVATFFIYDFNKYFSFFLMSFLLSIMTLIQVPYQDNGCDCGVFVCRYAYSLYTMRHQRFTNADYYEKPRFASLITRGPAFQFDMADIDRIRNEISTLIDNLSVLYLRGLKKQLEAARVAKRRAKQKESSDDVSNDVPDDKDEASVETEGDGKVILSSFEEKENIQQELGSLNSVLFAAPEKSSCEGFSDDALSLSLALTHLEPSYTYENYSDDPVEEGIVSETI